MIEYQIVCYAAFLAKRNIEMNPYMTDWEKQCRKYGVEAIRQYAENLYLATDNKTVHPFL